MSKLEKTLIGAAANVKKVVDVGANDVTHAAKDAVHEGEHAVVEVAHKAKIVIKETVKRVKGAVDAVVVDAVHAAHEARDNVRTAVDKAKPTK